MILNALPVEQLETPSRTLSRVMVSLIVMLIVTAVAIFTFLQIDRELKRSRTVESDNLTWVLAQIEVDVQNLQIALMAARANPAVDSLADLRLNYDILYSRVDLARKAPSLDGLSLRQMSTWDALAGKEGLIQQFLPLVDGPDPALVAALLEMTQVVSDLRQPVREMIVLALGESMLLGDMARQGLRGTLYTFMVALVVTLAGLTVLLATIHGQSRAQQRYAKMLELAIHNLRATIESARDAVLIVNSNDQIVACNKAGEHLLGRIPTASTPVPLSDILAASQDKTLQPGSDDRMECLTGAGRRVPVEVTIAATTTATGHAFKIAFLRDMTQQLERERDLAEASERARKGEEAKDRFLAVMSHEMRTPLSGLLSATDLIETTTVLDSQQLWLIGILRSCGLAALEQVNNILELTHLSARKADDYPHSEFCVAEVVRQQVFLYQALALAHGNTLTFTTDDTCNCRIHAPLPLLRRILNNLLSNATKFTRDGKIKVKLTITPTEQLGRCRFTLSIRDTGIGIAEADLERIFHNFETLDSSYARTQEGTGLGLGIAKLAAEALGGTTSVESRLGEGSCFTVTFDAPVVGTAPASMPDAPPAVATMSGPERRMPLNILLAEDNEINCLLMERQLQALGHRVTTANDGAEAIACAERAGFDIILMDISMPRVDGLAATRHLRDSGILGQTPVIALTAQAAPNQIQLLRAAGMAEVVTKPVPVAQLDQIMQRLVAKRSVLPLPVACPLEATLLDLTHLADLVEDIGVDLMDSMTMRFDHDMKETCLAVSAALSNGERQDLSRVAHKTAGAAAVLTMRELAATLIDIETVSQTADLQDLAMRCREMERLAQESLACLKQHLARLRTP